MVKYFRSNALKLDGEKCKKDISCSLYFTVKGNEVGGRGGADEPEN